MVLPASPPDEEPGQAPVAPWVERIAKLLRLVERGMVVLVDRASDAELGLLVRALAAEHTDLHVLTEAPRLEELPVGSVVVLATRAEDATFLNLSRPIVTERALRLVLFSKAEVTAALARKAPDFFDWIARRFECPGAPPAFAIHGLRAALLARSWAVAWKGTGLEAAFAAALPKRALARVTATIPDEALRRAVEQAGGSWIAWSNVFDERAATRLRDTLRQHGRRGRNVLDNPLGSTPGAFPVTGTVADLAEAATTLRDAGAASPEKLAAMLDLEPEAITLAAEALRGGMTNSHIETAILGATDTGAALGKLVGSGMQLDPIKLADHRYPGPILRAFVHDPRVRQARDTLAGRAAASLPPLTERIPSGPEGAQELRRLLWLFDAEHQMGGRLQHLLPAPRGWRAWAIEWPGDTTDIEPLIGQTSEIVVVAPAERDTARTTSVRQSAVGRTTTVYRIGQAHFEQLLRASPALLARYYPQEARALLPGYDGTDFDTLAARYREKIATLHNRLKTIGIPPEARPRESRVELPLADLFIPLHLVPEAANAAPMTLGEVLKQNNSTVVLGDPGMGKSTLLAYLALVFAGGAEIEGFTPPPKTVPLPISLRDFVRRQKAQPGLSFIDYLVIEARERHQLTSIHPAFFEATLKMGEAVVLFDGLDEVGNETARHAAAASIRAFAADYPHSRVWVTSRRYGYTENVRLPFEHVRIDHLDEAQINDFIGRWYAHQIANDPAEAEEQASSLREAVRRTPSVARLAKNPLLLTLMAFIHHGLRKLPKDRGELYDKCIEMLLKTWEQAKGGDENGAETGPFAVEPHRLASAWEEHCKAIDDGPK